MIQMKTGEKGSVSMVTNEVVSCKNGIDYLVIVAAHFAKIKLPAWFLNLQHAVTKHWSTMGVETVVLISVIYINIKDAVHRIPKRAS